MNNGFLGIDLGTSSVKAVVTEPTTGVIGTGRVSYQSYSHQPGWSEQNPEEWWNAAATAVRSALDQAGTSREVCVTGIGITGQMHSFVLINKNQRAIRNAITWMDTRSQDLVNTIQSTIDENGFTKKIWNHVSPGLTLAPLLWLKQHEPDSLKQASALLTAKDYIRMRLTGKIGADPTDGSATLLMDIENRRWLPEVLELFHIPTNILPPLSDPWELAGEVLPRHLEDLGLPSSKPVYAAVGCGDQQAAALANSINRNGDLQIMLGTGGQIASQIDHVPYHPVEGLNLFCSNKGWLLQASIQNGGSALAWVQNTFHAHWKEYEEAIDNTNIEQAPFFLPYLMAERTTMLTSNTAGCWSNILTSTTRQEMLYSSIEGVAFGLADAFEKIRENLPSITQIRLGGGGIRSSQYTQLLCDIIGSPMAVIPEENTTAIGAAICGGTAAGMFKNIEEAADALSPKKTTYIVPNMKRHEQLRNRQEQFQKLKTHVLAV